MSDTDVGATVRAVSVGLTKKPRQPTPRASIKSVINANKSRSSRLAPDMLKAPRQTYSSRPLLSIVCQWRKGIVAEKVLGRRAWCPSVFTKLHTLLESLRSGSSLLPASASPLGGVRRRQIAGGTSALRFAKFLGIAESCHPPQTLHRAVLMKRPFASPLAFAF